MRRLLVIVLVAGVAAQTPEEIGEGFKRYYANDLDGAEEIFTRINRQGGPLGFSAATGIHLVLGKRGKLDELATFAQGEFERTQDERYLTHAGDVIARNGNPGLARQLIGPVIDHLKRERLDPNVGFMLALALQQLGDSVVALRVAQQTEADFRAKNSPQWITMGLVTTELLGDSGRTNEALNEFELLLEGAPNNISVLNNFAYFLAVHNKQLGRARSISQKALALSPDAAYIMDTVGFILLKLGRTEEAIDELARSWRRQPASMATRSHLAQALVRRGKPSEKVQELLDALRSEPGADDARIGGLLLLIGE